MVNIYLYVAAGPHSSAARGDSCPVIRTGPPRCPVRRTGQRGRPVIRTGPPRCPVLRTGQRGRPVLRTGQLLRVCDATPSEWRANARKLPEGGVHSEGVGPVNSLEWGPIGIRSGLTSKVKHISYLHLPAYYLRYRLAPTVYPRLLARC
jgi:hypothetical protein